MPASDATEPLLAPAPRWSLPSGRPPSISVVIPVYNGADVVADAVASVLDGGDPPHELIVFDDGSTVGPERALAPFGDRVTVLSGPHRGAAAARNAAVAAATGEFVALLDADDRFLPGRLGAFARMASTRPDLDILATDAVLETGGETVGRFGEHTPFAVDDQRHAILDRCFFVCPAIRRTALVAVGGYDERLRTGEDWELAIRLILSGSVAGLDPTPLYAYRLHAGSLTAERIASLRDRVTLLELTREHPGLEAGDRYALERSLTAKRLRLARAEAELALSTGAADARRRAAGLALARGMAPRERAAALRWALAPDRAARVLAAERERGGRRLASAAPWQWRRR